MTIAQRDQARTIGEETPADRLHRGRAVLSMIKEVRGATDGGDQPDLDPHHQRGPGAHREPVVREVLALTEFL